MASQHYGSADVGFFLVGGRSILGAQTDIEVDGEAPTKEKTPIGVEWPVHQATGKYVASLSQSGFYDHESDAANDALMAAEGTAQVTLLGHWGNTIGREMLAWAGAFSAKYKRAITDTLHTAAATYQITGSKEYPKILKTLASISADGNTEATSVDQTASATPIPLTSNSIANPTVVDAAVNHGFIDDDVVLIAGVITSDPTINGSRVVTVTGAGGLDKFTVPVNVTTGGTGGTATRAWTKNGGSAYVSCTALSLGGWTSLIPKVRHSADNVTFADLVTMTAITAAPAAERKTVAAGTTVNRYLAASWAFTGAGAAHTATFVVGFARA